MEAACMPSEHKQPDNKINISPARFDAVIFDLEGVITQTATLHAAAWKQVFDAFLTSYANHTKRRERPFDPERDYRLYVDGKPRYEGARDFLASRGVRLPWGAPDDAPGFNTICALGNAKNLAFHQLLEQQGVKAYPSSVALIRELKRRGIAVAVITASRNGTTILQAANLLNAFDVRVDGVEASRLALKGKPAPDIFLEAVKRLKVKPERAIVVEDAVAGVQAGRQGGFGLVIGIARNRQDSNLLAQNGADAVVQDLSELTISNDACCEESEEETNHLESQDCWTLTYTAFIPEEEKRREALCALGNGYFTTRAAAAESVSDAYHYPGTYLAGGYNRLQTRLGSKIIEHEDLVNFPNWLCLNFRIENGPWFDLRSVQILSYRQTLDMRAGVLYRKIRFRDGKQREMTLSERRFVHMRYCHLAGLETKLTPHGWSGKVTIRSALDGRVQNEGSAAYQHLNKRHLQPLESVVEQDMLYLQVQTVQSKLRVAEAARTRLFLDGQPCELRRANIVKPGYVAQDMQVRLQDGETLQVEKLVSLFTSRDMAISEAGLASREALQDSPSFEQLVKEQAEAWRHLWQRFDLELETRENDSQLLPAQALHLHIFHILQTVSLHSIDLDTGIPPRGWTGETYQGHIFWDELFAFPFLTLHSPGITTAALKYRYRRLPEARKLAASLGVRGALFPWQSGSNGREETPKYVWDVHRKIWRPDYTYLQMHVNSAIAYNIWQYYQITGNLDFLFRYGAEILLEIARFWGDFCQYNPVRDRYEIHGVVGPDEYHMAYPDAHRPGINNNAYTNVMAVWVLCRAIELLSQLPTDHRDELCERLNLTDTEIQRWEEISRKMFVPFQQDGIISQFEGYENLKPFPWRCDGGVDAKAVRQALTQTHHFNEFQVSKQADVLMLFYLFSAEELKELFERLGYAFNLDTIPKNVDYYIRQTANNSTLSRVAHAWVLSRLDRLHAWRFMSCLNASSTPDKGMTTGPAAWSVFLEALGSDLLDIQGGTTAEGIHLGAMAGTVDILQRCYTGLVTRNGVLWLNPHLPEELTKLSFSLYYQHQSLRIEVTHHQLTVTARHSSAKSIRIGFHDEIFILRAGETLTFQLAPHKRTRKATARKTNTKLN
jgi:beta-phosphoglucomutase family hydrolase